MYFQIRTKTIINLAYVVTEEESELISGAKDNFKLLINILESCLERPDHHSKRFGFWAEECIEILNMLAANDANKVSINMLLFVLCFGLRFLKLV